MRNAFIGIDVAFAKKKRLPISICIQRNGRLVPEPLKQHHLKPPCGYGNAAVLNKIKVDDFTRKTALYIISLCKEFNLRPRRIAIDSPSQPRKEGTTRRAAEVAMDREGISCFATPSATEFNHIFLKVKKHLSDGRPETHIPHSNQLWMIVGFRLFEQLGSIAPCIEVYPQATARMLGSGQIHKSNKEGIVAQLCKVARYTGWPLGYKNETEFSDIAFGSQHDRLDAYLSAWVASLDESKRFAFGIPPYDVIWGPRIAVAEDKSNVYISKKKGSIQKSGQAPHSVRPKNGTTKNRLCPACGKHNFKRWPFGWDAHAAHRCTGLFSVSTDERKSEFKLKFGHLFKVQSKED